VTPILFPFVGCWWLYAAFTGGVLLLRALNLGVFHRDAHEVGFRETAAWSTVRTALALASGRSRRTATWTSSGE